MYSNDGPEDRVKQAFLSLIRHSDAVGCASPGLSMDDIEHLTEVVMKVLCCDTDDELRIPLNIGRAMSSRVIDYYDVFNFLDMYSADLFGQAMSHGKNTEAIADVDQMWAGIALRYRFCAMHEYAYFPLSAIIELREVIRKVSDQPDSGDAIVCRALETLEMLERSSIG
ncbi:MAG: hypothetical protein V4719_29190 [Planctomycetota bacterium]